MKQWTLMLIVAAALAACATSSRTASGYDPARFPTFDLAPDVRKIVETPGPQATLALNYLRFAEALKAGGDALDPVVAPDARFHDLEAQGFPRGLEGLKKFRAQINSAMPDERALITAMRFPSDDIIEVDLRAQATGSDGQSHAWIIHARDRFAGNRVVERWDTFESEKR